MLKRLNHFLLNLIACLLLEPRFRSGKWTIKPDVIERLKGALQARNDAFADAEKLFSEAGRCEGCHASCCHGAFNRFTVYDRISHLIAEADAAPDWGYSLKPVGSYAFNKNDEGQCTHYETGKGCRLPHEMRPAQCVWYTCGEIDRSWTAEQKAGLKKIRAEIDHVFWAYARALVFGGMDRL